MLEHPHYVNLKTYRFLYVSACILPGSFKLIPILQTTLNNIALVCFVLKVDLGENHYNNIMQKQLDELSSFFEWKFYLSLPSGIYVENQSKQYVAF